ARKRSKSHWSSRLRRVKRGGVAERNITELKGTSPRGTLRIKCKTTGARMADKPRMYHGERKLIAHLLEPERLFGQAGARGASALSGDRRARARAAGRSSRARIRCPGPRTTAGSGRRGWRNASGTAPWHSPDRYRARAPT